jgi:hypothetical protein
MSLLVPDVGEVELLKRGLFGRGGAITSSTNASPIVVTTTAAHGLVVGNSVIITDHLVNTNANGGPFVVSPASGSTFTLNSISGTTLTSVAGNGVGGATGFWSLAGMENGTGKLYKATHSWAETDTAGSVTECDFTNYVTVTLNSKLSTSAGWTVPASVSPTGAWSGESLVAEATYPQQSWTCGVTTNTVFGYFVVGATSTTLWWGEQWAASVALINGAILQWTPRFGQS